jgi:hypothetical protein
VIIAIETFIRGTRIGIFVPCRAGGSVVNHFAHSSFNPRKIALLGEDHGGVYGLCG